MSSARIALIVDSPLRDLPGLVLVADRLCRRGVTCHLVPMNVQLADVLALAPDVVLLNYLRTNNEVTARHYASAGVRIAVLDTEGGVFSPLPAEALRAGVLAPSRWSSYEQVMARDARLREAVELYCTWTPAFAEHLAKAGHYRRECLSVTGTPRVDFYAPRWRTAARQICEQLTADGDEPLVLVNGSFPLANPRFQTPERELAQLIEEFGYEPEFARRWQQTQRAAFEGMVRTANELALREPGVRFVVRPHPFESAERYADVLETLPNLALCKRGSVDGWILRSRALLHWGSSTALEAALADVPAFAPGWLPVHLPIPGVDAASRRPASVDALHAELADALAGRIAPTGEAKEAAREVFHTVDGSAHEQVSAALLELAERGRRVAEPRCRELASSAGLGSPAWRDAQARWDASEKRFDARDVERIASAIARAQGAAELRILRADAGHGAALRSLELRASPEPVWIGVRADAPPAPAPTPAAPPVPAPALALDLLESVESAAAKPASASLAELMRARTAQTGSTAQRTRAPRLAELMRMDGRSCAIVGGAGHIGRAAGSALAELGARVLLVDVDGARAEAAARALGEDFGVECAALALDVSDARAASEVPAEALRRFGRLDVVVHSAALVGSSPLPGWSCAFEEQSVETWRRGLDVNLTSAFLLAQACLPALRASGRGSLIHVASIYGVVGPDLRLYADTEMGQPAAYAASKGALVQLTRWLATALAPHVRVNAISPGGVLRGQPEPFVRRYVERTPLQRMACEQDLLGAVAYLASDLSAYVTGHNLIVDGGWTAW